MKSKKDTETIDREWHPFKQFRVYDLSREKIIYPQSIDFCWTPNSYVAIVTEDVGKTPFQASVNYVMEFTGLLDENEVEIYEGDICRFLFLSNEHGDIELEIGEIYWDERNAGYTMDRAGMYFIQQHNIMNVEVIGNIWENKEMLDSPFKKEMIEAYYE